MRIYTEVIFEWDDKQNKLVETSSKSFDYEGPMALCGWESKWETLGVDDYGNEYRVRGNKKATGWKAWQVQIKVPGSTEFVKHHYSSYDYGNRQGWINAALGTIKTSKSGTGGSYGSGLHESVDAWNSWVGLDAWGGELPEEAKLKAWVDAISGITEEDRNAKIALIKTHMDMPDGDVSIGLLNNLDAEIGTQAWYEHVLTSTQQEGYMHDTESDTFISTEDWEEANYGTAEWWALPGKADEYKLDPTTNLPITTEEYNELYPEGVGGDDVGGGDVLDMRPGIGIDWWHAINDPDHELHNPEIAKQYEEVDGLPVKKLEYTRGTAEWLAAISDPTNVGQFNEEEAAKWMIDPTGAVVLKPEYDAPSVGQAKMAGAIKDFVEEWTKVSTTEKASDPFQQSVVDALEALDLEEGKVGTALSDLEYAKELAQDDYTDAVTRLMGGEIDGEEIEGSYYTALGDITDEYENTLADIKDEYATRTGEAGTAKDISLEDETAFREENLETSRETAKDLIRTADAKIASRGFASTGVGKTAREMLSKEIGEGAAEIQEEYEKQRTRIKEGHTEALDTISAEWSHEQDDEGAFVGTRMRDLEKDYGEEGTLTAATETNRIVALKEYLDQRDADIDDEKRVFRNLSNSYNYLLDHYGAEKSGDKYFLKGVRGGTVEEAQDYLKTLQSDLLTYMQQTSTQMIEESEGTQDELDPDFFYDPFADPTSPLGGLAEQYGWVPYGEGIPGGTFAQGIEDLGKYGLGYATEVIGGLAYEPGEGLQLFSDFTDDEDAYTPDWAWTYEPEDE